MMKKVITIISGVILTAIVVLSVVYATAGIVEKGLLYDDIKITLRGEELKPLDVNGNYIEPFIIEGTTYLPVRGIASALGLTVDWDDNTKTVKLNEPKSDTTLLYDERKIKISFIKYEYTSDGDLKMRFRTDNRNMDDIELKIYNISVNGYMLEDTFKGEFPSGKKNDFDVVIKSDSLIKNNITYIRDIQLITDIHDIYEDKAILNGAIITITPDNAVMKEKEEYRENIYSDKFSYDDFVDFIMQNGVLSDNIYEVAYAFSVTEVEGIRPSLFALSLSYSEETKDIVMSIFMNRKTVLNSSETTRLYLTMGKNLQLYTLTGTISSLGQITGRVPANKDMHDPERIQIDKVKVENYSTSYGPINANVSDGLTKTYVATVCSELLGYVSQHGDGMFEKYGSELTFKFFGM